MHKILLDLGSVGKCKWALLWFCMSVCCRATASNPDAAATLVIFNNSLPLSADLAGPLSQRLDSFTITAATMSVAAVVLIPGGLALTYLRGASLTTTDTKSWLTMIYLGVVTMGVAYAVFFTGLRSTSSEAAMVATLIEPVTAVLIAVAFLGERLTLAGLVGCLLILTAIASLGRQTRTPPAQ